MLDHPSSSLSQHAAKLPLAPLDGLIQALSDGIEARLTQSDPAIAACLLAFGFRDERGPINPPRWIELSGWPQRVYQNASRIVGNLEGVRDSVPSVLREMVDASLILLDVDQGVSRRSELTKQPEYGQVLAQIDAHFPCLPSISSESVRPKVIPPEVDNFCLSANRIREASNAHLRDIGRVVSRIDLLAKAQAGAKSIDGIVVFDRAVRFVLSEFKQGLEFVEKTVSSCDKSVREAWRRQHYQNLPSYLDLPFSVREAVATTLKICFSMGSWCPGSNLHEKLPPTGDLTARGIFHWCWLNTEFRADREIVFEVRSALGELENTAVALDLILMKESPNSLRALVGMIDSLPHVDEDTIAVSQSQKFIPEADLKFISQLLTTNLRSFLEFKAMTVEADRAIKSKFELGA